MIVECTLFACRHFRSPLLRGGRADPIRSPRTGPNVPVALFVLRFFVLFVLAGFALVLVVFVGVTTNLFLSFLVVVMLLWHELTGRVSSDRMCELRGALLLFLFHHANQVLCARRSAFGDGVSQRLLVG